tara:strand:+ start:836 stop:1126 length:291 start_codon:yes stop_codon:yes gene_type:complete
MNLHEAVKHLVKSFDDDDDHGLPQGTYIAARCLINALWGIESERIFQKYIDSCEGRFYLKQGTADACLKDMLARSLRLTSDLIALCNEHWSTRIHD